MIRAFFRVAPNLLSLIGVLAAVATATTVPHWWSAIFLLTSFFCDGIYGRVKIFQRRASRMGAIVDAVADRISEVFWAVAFYRLGVPLAVVFAFAGLAAFQEYARARLSSAGVRAIGVVTPVERPVRAGFLFMAILAMQFTFAHSWVTPIAAILTLLQTFSFLLVLRSAYKQLH